MRQSLQRRWEIDAEISDLDMNDKDSVARYMGFDNEADRKGHEEFVKNEFWERLPNGHRRNKPEYGVDSEVAWRKYKKTHHLKF